MKLEQKYTPKFRESDADGKIGVKGYLNYFQDVSTYHMHQLGKGNDTLPEEYGICWFFTKYKIEIFEKADFTSLLTLRTWIERKRSSAVVSQAAEIEREGVLLARARLESCLFDMKKQTLTRLSAIDFPEGEAEDPCGKLGKYEKIPRDPSRMEYRYTYQVHYTDLDKSMHMTNQRYVNLLLDAFDSAFYREHFVTGLEIHYLSQCYEGEKIEVLCEQAGPGKYYLTGLHKKDRSLAVQGILETADRSGNSSISG